MVDEAWVYILLVSLYQKINVDYWWSIVYICSVSF